MKIATEIDPVPGRRLGHGQPHTNIFEDSSPYSAPSVQSKRAYHQPHSDIFMLSEVSDVYKPKNQNNRIDSGPVQAKKPKPVYNADFLYHVEGKPEPKSNYKRSDLLGSDYQPLPQKQFSINVAHNLPVKPTQVNFEILSQSLMENYREKLPLWKVEPKDKKQSFVNPPIPLPQPVPEKSIIPPKKSIEISKPSIAVDQRNSQPLPSPVESQPVQASTQPISTVDKTISLPISSTYRPKISETSSSKNFYESCMKSSMDTYDPSYMNKVYHPRKLASQMPSHVKRVYTSDFAMDSYARQIFADNYFRFIENSLQGQEYLSQSYSRPIDEQRRQNTRYNTQENNDNMQERGGWDVQLNHRPTTSMGSSTSNRSLHNPKYHQSSKFVSSYRTGGIQNYQDPVMENENESLKQGVDDRHANAQTVLSDTNAQSNQDPKQVQDQLSQSASTVIQPQNPSIPQEEMANSSVNALDQSNDNSQSMNTNNLTAANTESSALNSQAVSAPQGQTQNMINDPLPNTTSGVNVKPIPSSAIIQTVNRAEASSDIPKTESLDTQDQKMIGLVPSDRISEAQSTASDCQSTAMPVDIKPVIPEGMANVPPLAIPMLGTQSVIDIQNAPQSNTSTLFDQKAQALANQNKSLSNQSATSTVKHPINQQLKNQVPRSYGSPYNQQSNQLKQLGISQRQSQGLTSANPSIRQGMRKSTHTIGPKQELNQNPSFKVGENSASLQATPKASDSIDVSSGNQKIPDFTVPGSAPQTPSAPTQSDSLNQPNSIDQVKQAELPSNITSNQHSESENIPLQTNSPSIATTEVQSSKDTPADDQTVVQTATDPEATQQPQIPQGQNIKRDMPSSQAAAFKSRPFNKKAKIVKDLYRR